MSYHRRRFPHNKMTNALLGEKPAAKESAMDEDYLELCRIIEQVLPTHKSFAPASYFVKIGVLLTMTLVTECYVHLSGDYAWYLCFALGWFYALIGLNIQHDANHGSVSRNPAINRAFGLTQNYIGGSAVDWIHQHVVQHHISTNDMHEDPDVAGSSIVRLNPAQAVKDHYVFQHIYVFFLIALFGMITVVTAFKSLVSGVRYTEFSKLLTTYRRVEMLSTLFFLARWVALPVYTSGSASVLLNTIPLYLVAGWYLAFFFILSHNFEGVHMFDKSKYGTNTRSFLYKQVASSSNVGYNWLCFMNGGLNYQIEHHLFPRIQHTHYPKIAPVVAAFCKSKNIPYRHFPTIGENFLSCIRHLSNMAKDESLPRQ